MLFSDLIPQEAKDLGSLGVSGLMGVGLFAVAGALIWVVRTWRADLKEVQARHDAEKREQRQEFLSSLRDVTETHGEAITQLAAESKANTTAITQLAAELKANTAAIFARIDRLEMHLPAGR